jgi:hypothetical protein
VNVFDVVMVVVVGHVPVCNLVGRGKVGLRLEVGVGLKVGLRVVVTMVGLVVEVEEILRLVERLVVGKVVVVWVFRRPHRQNQRLIRRVRR